MPNDAQRIDAFDALVEVLRDLVRDDMSAEELERLCHTLAFDASPAQLRQVVVDLNSYLKSAQEE